LNPVGCTRLATLASSLFLLDHNDAGRFADPGDDPTYPIWSTVYVLDAQGTIRYKDVRGDRMDKAVEKLLAEMGHENALSGEATVDLLDESPDDSETDS
jgi:hypothetical protein